MSTRPAVAGLWKFRHCRRLVPHSRVGREVNRVGK